MDKIYSRRRIKLYTPQPSKKKKVRYKRLIKMLIVIIIAIITIQTILKSANPIFENICVSKARTIATNIINTKTKEILERYKNIEIVKVVHNEEENTNILNTNVIAINQILSDISIEVSKELKGLEEDSIKISLGAFLGNRYLSGSGPGINVKLMQTGNTTTSVKTEFEAIGINQSIYRIYAEITCNISILTPYKTIKNQSTYKVLLVETIIVGEVPETYYNLEGLDKEDTMNTM